MVQQQDEIQSEKPTSSKREEPSADELKEVNEVMSNGKRHLICNEPQLALEYFVQACEKLSSLYGQTGDECAEAYLCYGKTLLEIARLENGVLGHAIKETPVLGEDGNDTDQETKPDGDEEEAEVTSEKRNEIRAEVEHALRDGNLYNDASTEEDTEDEEVDESAEATEAQEKETDTESSKTTDAKKTSEVTEATSSKAEENSDEKMDEDDDVENVSSTEDDKEDEDVSNMQLSWEMFELTCLICSRQIKRSAKCLKEPKMLLAEAKYGLAQISLEAEHNADAIKDFTTCLELYTEILEDKQDRRIAEVLYNIGLALSFDCKFDEAIEKYQAAVDLLQERIKIIEEKVKEKSGKENTESEVEELNKEISELKDLVCLDMMAKIDDAKEMQKQATQTKEALKTAAKEIFSAVGTSSSFDQGFDQGFEQASKQSEVSAESVQDISHKIRSSKRKPDDEAPPLVDTKKMKKDDVTTNGHSNGTNGHANGHVNGNSVKS